MNKQEIQTLEAGNVVALDLGYAPAVHGVLESTEPSRINIRTRSRSFGYGSTGTVRTITVYPVEIVSANPHKPRRGMVGDAYKYGWETAGQEEDPRGEMVHSRAKGLDHGKRLYVEPQAMTHKAGDNVATWRKDVADRADRRARVRDARRAANERARTLVAEASEMGIADTEMPARSRTFDTAPNTSALGRVSPTGRAEWELFKEWIDAVGIENVIVTARVREDTEEGNER